MIRPWKVLLSVAVGAAVLPSAAMAQAPITITTPGGSGVYALNQVVNAAYSCSGVNIVTCEGTVPNGSPIDTASLGQKTFTVVARNADGNALATSSTTYQVTEEGEPTDPGGSPTLDLNLGVPTPFSPFVPGITQDYTSTLAASVLSTAGDTTLTVSDASTTNVGKMVNGSFALPQTVQVGAVKSGSTDAPVFAPLGGSEAPTPLLTYSDPVFELATVTFKQPVAATDALRTGSYSKTLTFTLSTTNP